MVDAADPDLDWGALQRLRAIFLEARSRSKSYWSSRSDLELYDATFAQRIAWKWDALLDEAARVGALSPVPADGPLLDFGCGTGIAARRLLARAPHLSGRTVLFFDRDPEAARFACEALHREWPQAHAQVCLNPAQAQPAWVVASHVLCELEPNARQVLLACLAGAERGFLLEPGARGPALAVSALRDELAPRVHFLAPCPHQAGCGARDAAERSAWCHFFAPAPPDVHRSAFWRRFGEELGIDVRALPYSYLVWERRGARTATFAPGADDVAGLVLGRVLGRPRLEKGRARLDVCTAQGVESLDLLERTNKDLTRRWRDPAGARSLLRLRVRDKRVESAVEEPPHDPT